MTKYPIDWHQNCLNNSRSYLHHERQTLERKLKDLERAERANEFYEHQIQTARNKELDGFDRERFLKKERKWDE